MFIFHVKSQRRNGSNFQLKAQNSLRIFQMPSTCLDKFQCKLKIITLYTSNYACTVSWFRSVLAYIGKQETSISEYRSGHKPPILYSAIFFFPSCVPFLLSLSLPSFLGGGPSVKENPMERNQVERGKARRPSETKVVLPDKRSEKERREVCMEVISGHSFRPDWHLYKDVTFT